LIFLSPTVYSGSEENHLAFYSLTGISVLVDASQKKKINDIVQVYKTAQLFSKVALEESINFGFSQDSYWITANVT